METHVVCRVVQVCLFCLYHVPIAYQVKVAGEGVAVSGVAAST